MSALSSIRQVVLAHTIGASMIAAVCDMSRYITRWEAWALILGLIVKESTLAMRVGNALERPVAALIAREYGLENEWFNEKRYHPDRPWQHATADALVPYLTSPRAALEIKTVGFSQLPWWSHVDRGEIGDESGVPDDVLCQVNWQMDVLGLDEAYVGMLHGNDDLRLYRCKRDQALIDIMVPEGEQFYYTNLVGGVEPRMEYSSGAKAYLKARFPRPKEKIRHATDEEIALLEAYRDVRVAMKPLAETRKQLEIALERAVAEAEGIEWAGMKFTWKRTADKHGVDWEALGKKQIADFSPEQQDVIKAEFTGLLKEGYRRIGFKGPSAGDEEEG